MAGITAIFDEGMHHVHTRRWPEARACFAEAIRLDPNFVQAHNNLGNTWLEEGHPNHALACFQQALLINNGFAQARLNLGVALERLGRLDEAEACLRQTINEHPAYAEAYSSLGNVLYLQARHVGVNAAQRLPASAALAKIEEAAACYREALRLRPLAAEALNNLGTILVALDRLTEAQDCFFQAVRLNPTVEGGMHNLASLLRQLGNLQAAADWYHRILDQDPDDMSAHFWLAAVTGKETPVTAPAQHVTAVFDEYAARFDEHLLGPLKYQGPRLLRAALPDPPNIRSLTILDLGCGTGLCGLEFRDLAQTLVGVDLSANMLVLAESRGIYDELIQGDILETLRSRLAAFDLIVAADVFIYVGDLSAVFPAVRAALRPGGRFLFHVEANETGNYVLLPSGRFAHSAVYIRLLATAAGMSEMAFHKDVIRTESSKAVEGYVFVLR